MEATYSQYEKSALEDVLAWKTPYRTPLSTLVHLGKSIEARPPSAGGAETAVLVRGVIRSVVALLNAGAQKSIGAGATLAAFRKGGHFAMQSTKEIAKLDLWEVDEIAEGLRSKYVVAAGGLGLATGGFGLGGLIANAAVTIAIGLRAVNDYAEHYGFDTSDPVEQKFVAGVLLSALSPRSQPDMMEESLGEVTDSIAKVSGFAGIVKTIGALAGNLARSRGARVLPVVGAVASSAFSAWFVVGVSRAAELAYRERFVARKYRQHVVARPVDLTIDPTTCGVTPLGPG